MQKFFSERRTSITITWLLAGLFVGCMFSSLPATKRSLECAEERVLETEVEDDRDDLRGLDLALHIRIMDLSPFQTWNDFQVFVSSQPSQIEQRSNFVRGPPRS